MISKAALLSVVLLLSGAVVDARPMRRKCATAPQPSNVVPTNTETTTVPTDPASTMPDDGQQLGPPIYLGKNFKRGFSFPAQEPNGGPIRQFFDGNSKLTWFYNWAKSYSWMPGTENLAGAGDFVPMVWGSNSLYEGSQPGADPKSLFNEGISLILGFNEPDHPNPDTSAGMAVPDAVERWKEMFRVGREANPDMQFASPAMASSHEWQRDFFNQLCPGGLNGCEFAPQYLAVHDYNIDPQVFINNMEQWHNEYPELPIIVTEFACNDFAPDVTATEEQVNYYMDTVIPWLDNTDYIYRYAWFTATTNVQALFGVAAPNSLLDNSGAMTALGRKYISM